MSLTMKPIDEGEAKRSFKVNFFYLILDTAINSLKERSELMDNHSKSSRASAFYTIFMICRRGMVKN